MKLQSLYAKAGVSVGTALLLACSSFTPLFPATKAAAHGGGEQNYVELRKTMEAFGAKVTWEEATQSIVITKGDRTAKVTVNSSQALVDNNPVQLESPVILKNGMSFATDHFLNEIFQSDLDQTVKVSKTEHPLNPLTDKEIQQAVQVLKASGNFKESLRFTEISLVEPDKQQVWNWTYRPESTPMPERHARIVVLDGKQVIEGEANLNTGKLLSWNPIDGVQGMILADDFITAQSSIEASKEYADALAKRGITDVKKVVATPLTVGYFGGEDGLEHDKRLLKVVAYLDAGDGNYFAHPIENLVAIVDLEKKEVIQVEDDGVIPIPMQLNAYDGRDYSQKADVLPVETVEPEGKNYRISGNLISWNNWDFHLRLDSRVGPILSTLTYNDQGKKRKIMYEGSLGGMVVPYGDPDVGWYFKTYFDSGEYGMGGLTSSLKKGSDVPSNAVLLDATIADNNGNPRVIPNAIAVFEQYSGPEYRHDDFSTLGNEGRERRELVVRWISTVGNYDYIFDWVLQSNGTIKIDVGASGLEAVKGVVSKTMHDETAAKDTRYGTLLDNNIVGTTHQHIYNFRLDMDVDGENNTLKEIDPKVAPNTDGGPRKSVMVTEQKTVQTEQEAMQKFDPSTVRLLTNPNVENKVGNPVSYQIIPFAGGTHPIAKGALFSEDDWLFKRVSFMDKQIWVTNYDPLERYPEGEYPNRSDKDTGLGAYTADNGSIVNKDNVVWITTGATHVARAEEWPIMPTEWVHAMLKPWNFFDRTPTLDLPKPSE